MNSSKATQLIVHGVTRRLRSSLSLQSTTEISFSCLAEETLPKCFRSASPTIPRSDSRNYCNCFLPWSRVAASGHQRSSPDPIEAEPPGLTGRRPHVQPREHAGAPRRRLPVPLYRAAALPVLQGAATTTPKRTTVDVRSRRRRRMELATRVENWR